MKTLTCLTLTALGLSTALHAADGPAALEMRTGWWTETGDYIAAFDITLEEGWKTYWRSPGDAGIPPQISWTETSNLADVTLHWPSPHVFDSLGARTVGYEHRLVLPIQLTPGEAGQPMTAAGRLDIGVCSDICVLVPFEFSVAMPASEDRDGPVAVAMGQLPEHRDANTIAGLSCEFDALRDGMAVRAIVPPVGNLGAFMAVFEYGDPGVWVSGAEIVQQGAAFEIRADMVPPETAPFAIARDNVTLTLIGETAAIEISGCPAG